MSRAAAARGAAAVVSIAVAGCAGSLARVEAEARDAGFERLTLHGRPFEHRAWVRGLQGPLDELHVYLEHDGVPWATERQVSADPTPTRPVMLRLMQLDPKPVLYLGRPCHFGLQPGPPCEPRVWTDARYSPQVVESLRVALQSVADRHLGARVLLFGHSGGGTLAALLAARVPQVVAVVSIAGNLDTARWTTIHGYSPLDGSLNPAAEPPLRGSIRQWHYVGLADRNTPPELARRYAARQPGATVVEVPDADHDCCWQRLWPGILRRVADSLTDR